MYTRKTKEIGLFSFISLLLHLVACLLFIHGASKTPWEKIAFYIPQSLEEKSQSKDYIIYMNLRGNGGVTKVKQPLKNSQSFMSGNLGEKMEDPQDPSQQNLSDRIKAIGLKVLGDTESILGSSGNRGDVEVKKISGDFPVKSKGNIEELNYEWKGNLTQDVLQAQMPNKQLLKSTHFNSSEGSTSSNNNNASIGVVIPKGVKEEALNKWQMVLYSFHKRVFSQYLTQLYIQAQNMERNYPYSQFPYVREPDSVRVKATYEEDGTLTRVEKLKQSGSRLLNEFFQNAMQDMDSIPNPPKLIINDKGQFELIFEVKVVY